MSLEDRGASTERLTHYHCWGIFFLLFFLSGPRVFAAEQQLGTMFYSPAERRALVAARTGVDDGKKVGEESAVGKKTNTSSARYTVSGLVSRSGGKSVAWINGQPVGEIPHSEGLPLVDLRNGQIVIDGKTIKVGETIDIHSGEGSSPLPEPAAEGKP